MVKNECHKKCIQNLSKNMKGYLTAKEVRLTI